MCTPDITLSLALFSFVETLNIHGKSIHPTIQCYWDISKNNK